MKICNMILLLLFNLFISCTGNNANLNKDAVPEEKVQNQEVIVGAARTQEYLHLLKDKHVGLVVNQTSTIGNDHLVDMLIEKKIKVKKLFAPEHGIRGKEDAGAKIEDGKDAKTGLDILSLYGKKKKPAKEDLEGLDILVFDIQDVGVRFYTYISTLHYVMEAAAENDIPLIVLDRPNPNAHYVDGPILEKEFSSFVGMHPVPVVYGLTIGEYAKMINGEKWLLNEVQCDLKVILCEGYDHNTQYPLPIKPSPNLPNYRSILLYPSLCFFEGTHVSVGRGTSTQFQVIGSPLLKGKKAFSFTPVSMDGAKYPKHENTICYGDDLTQLGEKEIFNSSKLDLGYLMEYARMHKELGKEFFLANNFFNKLAGNAKLQAAIREGKTEEKIRESWKEDHENYSQIRKNYLLYNMFE